jgi:hypothetical protein
MTTFPDIHTSRIAAHVIYVLHILCESLKRLHQTGTGDGAVKLFSVKEPLKWQRASLSATSRT